MDKITGEDTLQRDLKLVREELEGGTSSLVVEKDGKIIWRGEGRGIAPLLQLITEERDSLPGAILGDKVVGRAAALLIVDKGLRLLYTPLISEKAIPILEGKVPYHYLRKVPFILRRDGKGQCPVESRVSEVTDPAVAEDIIREFLKSIST